MMVKNALRTLLGIRVERQQVPAGEMPPVGSNIVLGTLRIRLMHPISDEQWDWLTALGWRTIDTRTDRRRYLRVPDKAVKRMLNADRHSRDRLHYQLLLWTEKHTFKSARLREQSGRRQK